MSRKTGKPHPEIQDIKNIYDIVQKGNREINPPQKQEKQPGL